MGLCNTFYVTNFSLIKCNYNVETCTSPDPLIGVILSVDSLQQFLHDSVFCGWEPPKFQHCWEKHGKLLPEALGLSAKTVAKWNTEEVKL